MLNIYIHKKLDKLSHIPLLDYYFGRSNLGVERYGDQAIGLLNKQFFNLVMSPEEADYFLIPHNFFYIKDQKYLDDFVGLSKKYNKKIIIFSYGDSDNDINIPNSIIFRSSQYAYKARRNEIIMPAIADDLSIGLDLRPRQKSEKPVVGFCGWADYPNFYRAIIENIKSTVVSFKSVFIGNYYYQKRGLMFRIEAIKHLRKSNLLQANFIIRDTFSGNEKTRKIDPKVAREEYIKNILESDMSLAVKGDGNFSIRFYEILSLGRIPILVDTSCPLPLKDIVKYSDFSVRVDSKNLSNLSETILKFYTNLSEDQFIMMQKNAKITFDSYLRIDQFFSYTFTAEFLKKFD
ncbi:MAG: exostosin family protein [Minisyncoccia bacterium]